MSGIGPTAELHDLRADGWPLRVPTLALTLGPTVVAALALASFWNEPAGYSGDVAEVSSWSELLIGIPVGVALGAVLIGWFAPRPGAWAMAIGVFPPLFSDASTDGGGGWFSLVGWAWLAVVVLDLVLVTRQRALVARPTPAPAGPRAWRADHHRGVRALVAAVVVVGITAGFTQWMGWRDDVRGLADRAVPTPLPVTRTDRVFDSVFVRVEGREREFFVGDAADHPVGSTFVVYVDPTGAMDPYGAEDADPDGWSDMGIPIGAGLLVLWVVGVEIGRRRRRVEALASVPDEGVPVLIRLHPVHDGVEVFADTDHNGQRPLAFLPALELLLPRDGVLPRWATDDVDADEPGFIGDHLQPARVVGLVSDGSLCVLRTPGPEGDVAVLASVRPARDRWTLRTVALRAGNRILGQRVIGALRGATAHEATADEGDHGLESVPALVRQALLLARRAAPGAVVALCLLGLVAIPWLNEGEPGGPEVLLLAAPAGSLASWWWGLRRERVLASRWGLRLTGTWLDQLVVPTEITEVRRLSNALVLELGEDQTFELGPDPLLDEAAQQRELDDLLAVVDTARARAREGRLEQWGTWWPRRLPSVTTAVGLLVFAVWTIAGLRG